MKTVKDFDVRDKRVLVRCDFNVTLDGNGEIADDFRIKASLPTIQYLIEQEAKIILMSHLGKPKGKVVEGLRLNKIKDKLAEYLKSPILKIDDCVGREAEKMTANLRPGQILLLENLRFHKEEEENNDEFAKALSRLGEIYINDAFGACHRAHASIVGIPKYLPSGAGLLLAKEIKVLSDVVEKPWRPLAVIIGGVKISTKAKVIERFLNIADHLMLGGEIANVILRIQGYSVGKPLNEDENLDEIKKFELTSPKLHLPVDVIAASDIKGEGYSREAGPAKVRNDELVLDIGAETCGLFSRIVSEAKMIVWAGPMGFFEEKKFEKGTKKIAEAIALNHDAFKIAGGGDTIAALNKFGVADEFDHISTGGGAMLAFLGGEEMPGLEALE